MFTLIAAEVVGAASHGRTSLDSESLLGHTGGKLARDQLQKEL